MAMMFGPGGNSVGMPVGGPTWPTGGTPFGIGIGTNVEIGGTPVWGYFPGVIENGINYLSTVPTQFAIQNGELLTSEQLALLPGTSLLSLIFGDLYLSNLPDGMYACWRPTSVLVEIFPPDDGTGLGGGGLTSTWEYRRSNMFMTIDWKRLDYIMHMHDDVSYYCDDLVCLGSSQGAYMLDRWQHWLFCPDDEPHYNSCDVCNRPVHTHPYP